VRTEKVHDGVHVSGLLQFTGKECVFLEFQDPKRLRSQLHCKRPSDMLQFSTHDHRVIMTRNDRCSAFAYRRGNRVHTRSQLELTQSREEIHRRSYKQEQTRDTKQTKHLARKLNSDRTNYTKNAFSAADSSDALASADS
jgi:hypothetical protein